MNEINLLPKRYKDAYRRKWLIGIGVVSTVLIIWILTSVAFILMSQIKIEKENINYLDEKLKNKDLAGAKSILEKIEDMNRERLETELFVKNISSPSYVTRKTIDAMVSVVPKELKISEIIMESSNNTIAINGSAKHLTSIAEYIFHLESNSEFQDVTYYTNQLESISGTDWIQYGIQFKLKSHQQAVDMNDEMEANDENS